MKAKLIIESILAEDTRDCWIVTGPSGVSKRIYGAKDKDDAISKFASRCSYKTLDAAKKAGVKARFEKGLTQRQQGTKNAEKHRKWLSR